MTNYEIEVARFGGEVLLNAVKNEFKTPFFIVARDPDTIVIGIKGKNVKFARKNARVIERQYFDDKVRRRLNK